MLPVARRVLMLVSVQMAYAGTRGVCEDGSSGDEPSSARQCGTLPSHPRLS